MYPDVSLSHFSPSRGPLRFIASHSRATRVSRSPLRKTKRLRRRQRSRAIIKRLVIGIARGIRISELLPHTFSSKDDYFGRIAHSQNDNTLNPSISFEMSGGLLFPTHTHTHTHKKTNKKIIKKTPKIECFYKAKSSRRVLQGLFTWR